MVLYHLLDRLIERAAKLAALTLSGAVLKSAAGEDPCAPVCAVVEGSVYWGLKGMRRKVDSYLKDFLEEKHGRYLEARPGGQRQPGGGGDRRPDQLNVRTKAFSARAGRAIIRTIT